MRVNFFVREDREERIRINLRVRIRVLFHKVIFFYTKTQRSASSYLFEKLHAMMISFVISRDLKRFVFVAVRLRYSVQRHLGV